MPTYEYACRSCGEHLEVVQSFKDDALTTCPSCEGELRKVFSAAGIIFKGSGWHIKDYASGSGAAGSPAKESAGSESSGSDAKGSDAKGSESSGSTDAGSKGAGSSKTSSGSSDSSSSSAESA